MALRGPIEIPAPPRMSIASFKSWRPTSVALYLAIAVTTGGEMLLIKSRQNIAAHGFEKISSPANACQGLFDPFEFSDGDSELLTQIRMIGSHARGKFGASCRLSRQRNTAAPRPKHSISICPAAARAHRGRRLWASSASITTSCPWVGDSCETVRPADHAGGR
jgi:hypothetical protein